MHALDIFPVLFVDLERNRVPLAKQDPVTFSSKRIINARENNRLCSAIAIRHIIKFEAVCQGASNDHSGLSFSSALLLGIAEIVCDNLSCGCCFLSCGVGTSHYFQSPKKEARSLGPP